MKNIMMILLVVVISFVSISLGMDQKHQVSKVESTEQSIKEKNVTDRWQQESNEYNDNTKKRLPEIIKVVTICLDNNKPLPTYMYELFPDLEKINTNNAEIMKLYSDIIEKSIDIEAKFYVISALQNHFNSDKLTIIPILRKAITDDSLFVSCDAANMLFDLGEEVSVYPVYKSILTTNNFVEKLDTEIPIKMKQIGFYGDKSNAQWNLYFNRVKSSFLLSILQRISTYNKPEVRILIKEKFINDKLLTVIEETTNADLKDLQKKKNEYPKWNGYITLENRLKSKIVFIESFKKQ